MGIYFHILFGRKTHKEPSCRISVSVDDIQHKKVPLMNPDDELAEFSRRTGLPRKRFISISFNSSSVIFL